MFYSDIGKVDEDRKPLPAAKIAENAEIAKRYLPHIQRFRGKKWVFHPRALDLPRHTDGNIFRLKDGSVMITMVSYWRAFREADGFNEDVPVSCRLPDAENMKHVYAVSVDGRQNWKVKPKRSGDQLDITVPRHGKATVILLSPRPDAALEGGPS